MFCVLEEIIPAPLSLFDMDISTEQKSASTNVTKLSRKSHKMNDLAILNITVNNMMMTFF